MASSVTLEVREIRAALKRLEKTKGGRFERTALSLREAAAALQVSPRLLAAMIYVGEVRVARVDRRELVPLSEVKRLRP